MSPVHATRYRYIPCKELHPTFAKASLDEVMGLLRTATGKDWGNDCLVKQLPRFGESALAPLVALLRSGTEQGRINAVSGLSAMGELALPATADLDAALDDPDAYVRLWAAGALGFMRARSPALTLHVLRRMEQGDSNNGLIEALQNLGRLPPQALPILAHALERTAPYRRGDADAAIEAISHVASVQRVVLLARVVGGNDSYRAWSATLAIGRSGVLAMPVLLYGLIDSDGQHRKAYAEALAWAWQVATTPSLQAYFESDRYALIRQLRAPLPADRTEAMLQLTNLVPAIMADIPVRWEMGSMDRGSVRCRVLDALDDGMKITTDEAERKSMRDLAVSLHRYDPVHQCPLSVY